MARWVLSAATTYNYVAAQRWLNERYPFEEHNVGGDCINAKCDYEFTEQDITDITAASGWFSCPQCGKSYNYLDDSTGGQNPGGYTRSGLSLNEMGMLGEKIIERLGMVPGVGDVKETFYHLVNYPIDAIIGDYGVEIKSIHSEAQQRFKIGGDKLADPDQPGVKLPPRQMKIAWCERNGLQPGLLGLRLNFYHDKADLFWRPQMTDTWIGNALLEHVAAVDFADLNPFNKPEDVPPPSEMPDDDGIPF